MLGLQGIFFLGNPAGRREQTPPKSITRQLLDINSDPGCWPRRASVALQLPGPGSASRVTPPGMGDSGWPLHASTLRCQARLPARAPPAAALHPRKAGQEQPRDISVAEEVQQFYLGLDLFGFFFSSSFSFSFFFPLPSLRRKEPPLTSSCLPRPEQRAPPEAIPLRLPENARERKKGAKEGGGV